MGAGSHGTVRSWTSWNVERYIDVCNTGILRYVYVRTQSEGGGSLGEKRVTWGVPVKSGILAGREIGLRACHPQVTHLLGQP